MRAVTTRRSPKSFSWSYSKLKNFESCPKRHYHVDVVKDYKEEEGESLLFGNELHKAMAARLQKGTPLPKGFAVYEPWAERMLTPGGNLLVEQKFAIDANFGPVEFFDKNAWFRGVADVLRIKGSVGLAVDWKTGKIIEDSQQLALMAACVFAHFPEVHALRTEFVWLKDDAQTRADFRRTDMPKMWAGLWPRISALEQAHNTTTYPAKPGFLCRRYCPVTGCPHHGE